MELTNLLLQNLFTFIENQTFLQKFYITKIWCHTVALLEQDHWSLCMAMTTEKLQRETNAVIVVYLYYCNWTWNYSWLIADPIDHFIVQNFNICDRIWENRP